MSGVGLGCIGSTDPLCGIGAGRISDLDIVPKDAPPTWTPDVVDGLVYRGQPYLGPSPYTAAEAATAPIDNRCDDLDGMLSWRLTPTTVVCVCKPGYEGHRRHESAGSICLEEHRRDVSFWAPAEYRGEPVVGRFAHTSLLGKEPRVTDLTGKTLTCRDPDSSPFLDHAGVAHCGCSYRGVRDDDGHSHCVENPQPAPRDCLGMRLRVPEPAHIVAPAFVVAVTLILVGLFRASKVRTVEPSPAETVRVAVREPRRRWPFDVLLVPVFLTGLMFAITADWESRPAPAELLFVTLTARGVALHAVRSRLPSSLVELAALAALYVGSAGPTRIATLLAVGVLFGASRLRLPRRRVTPA